MRKREQFAVTLRKQKTKNIIAHKRRRLMQGLANQTSLLQADDQSNQDVGRPEYSGYPKFNTENQAWLAQLVNEIAPALSTC